ncbi:MAG: twin-arginine translocation signal domain-containing protein [Nitrosopumilus sp. H8]|nr:MAG: twin-arginine translocation signal domain-containing protein [Nitrosopumilus sp. H13]RNJ78651.1 MAG: twin-arginine translocation signal domain-containing protein [Nitrosopumilus sp. H8]
MSELGAKKSGGLSRRDFLKLMGAAGTGLAFAPFVPFGNFMPNPRQASLEKVPVTLPDGKHANIKSFPVNHAEIITYPATGDSALDAEAFRKWQFIRLPEELGGSKSDPSALRAYSMICLHLWCLWKYWPDDNKKQGECPCHGSIYDPSTGTAFEGPASLQAPPSNTLARLTLEIDSDGFVFIMPPKFDVHKNGVIGYGRFA